MCGGDSGLLTAPHPEQAALQSPAEVKSIPRKPSRKKAGLAADSAAVKKGKIVVYLFRGEGCPHCEKELAYLKTQKGPYPGLEIRDFEVWYNRENAGRMGSLLKARGMTSPGVPVTLIDDLVFIGFSGQTQQKIAAAIEACAGRDCRDPADVTAAGTALPAPQEKSETVDIPILGSLDVRQTSLPVLTLIIAGLDSFNPCAFFVLFTLLGLLVHAQSRNKMFLIGGVFVFFSGFIYFLFMAAWLNLFLVMGQVAVITAVAGVVSIVIAGINIKDFFVFKQGVSLSIPDSAKPMLFDRMRKLLRSTSLYSVLAGTVVLAVVANMYELLCTAGFPMVFTRILTLNKLSTASYYFYLLCYNIVYVIPLFVIVVAFTITLGSRKLTEWQGRVLKLVSGCMMLGLGIVLVANPALLNNAAVSVVILAASLALALLLAAAIRIYEVRFRR